MNNLENQGGVNKSVINWYPGHMTKAVRQMKEDIKLIDLVIELLDARIPLSSRNPDIDDLGKNKARLVLLNKSDLADETDNNKWIQYFKDKGIIALKINSKNKQGIKEINNAVQIACKEKIERDKKRGIINRPVRAMVVGIPNVGKSTFISVVSEAKPNIANYHFTTLTPVLGVVRMEEGNSFVIADIPGLIEGAWEGVGLGHQFLRHVERCRMLVHVVDISGSEGRDPKEDFNVINQELQKFNPELAQRPMIVVGNKADLATDEQIAEFEKFVTEQGYEFYPIMAAIRYGVDPVLKSIEEKLSKLPPVRHFEPEAAPVKPIDEIGKHHVEITKQGDIYVVEGEWLLAIMKTIDFDDYESLQYFQRVLIHSGVIDALRNAGIEEGDTVSLYDLEFDFVE